MKCSKCQEESFRQGFCEKHYKAYWKDRWDPKHGWIAAKRFLFECFPSWFQPEYGCPEHMEDAVRRIFTALTNGKTVEENSIALFIYRGGGKTTIIKGMVAYCIVWILGDSIMYRGVDLTSARRNFLDGLKDMLDDPVLTSIFGRLLIGIGEKHQSAKRQNNEIVTLNGVRVIIRGAEQSNRGALKKKRIFWVIPDDIESQDNTKTDLSREMLIKKIFQEDVPACRLDKSLLTYIATPWPDGLYYEIKNNSKFKKVEYWLYKQDKDGSWLTDNDGNRVPQWPELWPLHKCLEREAYYLEMPKLGRKMFNQEYLGILSSDEEKAIPEEAIQYREYDFTTEYNFNWVIIRSENGIQLVQPVYKSVFTVMAVDPASSLDPANCDSAGIVLDQTYEYDFMFRDSWMGKNPQRDILIDPSKIAYNEIELNRTNILREGNVGIIFRKLIEHRPNVLVLEVTTGFESLYQDIQMIKDTWYRNKFPGHTFSLIRFNGQKDGVKKEDWIASSLRGIFDVRRGFVRGALKDIKNDYGEVIKKNGIKPQRELIHQLTNLGSIRRIDLADAASSARNHSRPPVKMEYTDAIKNSRPIYGDDEPFTQSVSEAFEGSLWR